ncbi:MAG: glycosyltransferase [Candidatus Anammoxibacter sp.]
MISVVTITYNDYEGLRKTLDSVKGVRNIESIVINGGDCTKTRSYLSQIETRSVSEPDKGISDAFNKGLKISKGNAVMFLNSGDVLKEKSYFEKAEAILDRKPDVGFVHGSIIFRDLNCGDILMKPRLCALGRGMPYYHQSMIVRKSVFDETGNFSLDYKLGMDFDIVCRMHKLGFKGYYWSDSPVVVMDGTGITSTNEVKGIIESFHILKNNDLLNCKNSVELVIRYSFYLIRMVLIKLGLSKYLTKLKIFINKRPISN